MIKGSLSTWRASLNCPQDSRDRMTIRTKVLKCSFRQITNLGGREEWDGMGEVHENEAPRELVKVYLLKHKSIREIASSLGDWSRHSWHDNSKS